MLLALLNLLHSDSVDILIMLRLKLLLSGAIAGNLLLLPVCNLREVGVEPLLHLQLSLEIGYLLSLVFVGGVQASEPAQDLLVVLAVVLDSGVGEVLLLDHELVAPLPGYGSQGPIVSLAPLLAERLQVLRCLRLLLHLWDDLEVEDAALWLKIYSSCRHRYIKIALSWHIDVVSA